jgi:phospholipase C
MGMENIEHVVVVMFENRSFDNLLGWLYDNDQNRPKLNIPTPAPGELPTFEGLSKDNFFNTLVVPQGEEKVYAVKGTSSWPSCGDKNQVPTPDPHEEFEYVTQQIFGRIDPGQNDKANMSGFLQNYFSTEAVTSCGQIMETYGPEDANVINDLARAFAVCDGWFASVPSQTWPNRGFAHSRSSDGHVNNDSYEFYHNKTIFNVLEAQGIPWKIFSDTYTACLTYLQFWQNGGLRDHVHRYSAFGDACAAAAEAGPEDKLPTYSFIEPRFLAELFKWPSDYHPPHNICRGETFLAEVYKSVRNSPYRDKILLIVTFDEHGGCYDHVPPPTGAAPPEPHPVSLDGKFKFDRFGVRVPTIVISSYVEPGTVFRAAASEAPYDHTSILATLRDWLKLEHGVGGFLPSPRIKAAPTLDRILTRGKGEENKDWPGIAAKCLIDGSDESKDIPLNDLQKSILAGAKAQQAKVHPAEAASQAKRLVTYEHGAMFLQFDNKEPRGS